MSEKILGAKKMFGIKTKIYRKLGLIPEQSQVVTEYERLIKEYEQVPRFEKTSIKFKTFTDREYCFEIPDVASFLSTYKELFVEENYKFSDESEKQYTIVDFGANIGLSMLYFYEKFPNCKVIGFEADPNIFACLKKNIDNFQIDDIRCEIRNEAVWNENTTLNFYSQGGDGGRIAENGSEIVAVNAINGHSIFEELDHVDFLKIDIEGAEKVVIPAIKNDLNKVDKIFIEYHSEIDKPQCMAEIFSVLENVGFRLYINSVFSSVNPYIEVKDNTGFDLQFELYGIRR